MRAGNTIDLPAPPFACLRILYHPCILSIVFILLFFCGCSKSGLIIQQPSEKVDNGECVVLLHGLARSSYSMTNMQTRLTLAGYHTVNLSYPSTKETIETIASQYLPPAIQACVQFSPQKIHFVTHSLGGIIIRKALKDAPPENLGKVVMFSPPNQGSAVADALKDWWIYSWVNGPAGQQLTTAPDSLPNQLGPATYPVGIITGDHYAFFDAWFSFIIPGIDDGKVSVERTKLEGMTDFLVVHATHPFIMDSQQVHEQTIHFLQYGSFIHTNPSHPPVAGSDWFSLQSK